VIPTQRLALLIGDLDSVKAVQVFILKKCGTPDWEIAVLLKTKPRALKPTIQQVNHWIEAREFTETWQQLAESL
jgi:hypothetical protein